MSPSLVDDLALIRQMQGRDPMPDPSVIGGAPMPPRPLPEGFGEPTASEQDPWDDPGSIDVLETNMGTAYTPIPKDVSPLVAAGRPVLGPPKPTAAPMPGSPILDLCVFDSEAAFLGHPVTLTDKEKRQVTQIVLKALQRVVREQLASLVRLTPKRPRRGKPEASHKPVASDRRTASETVGDIPVRPGNMPKKRGRPRGSLLGKAEADFYSLGKD